MNEVSCTSILLLHPTLTTLITIIYYCVAFHILAWWYLSKTMDTYPVAPNDGKWNMASLSELLPIHV